MSKTTTRRHKNTGKSLRKEQFLAYWSGMKRRRKLTPTPVPYKHAGSTYDQDGIRITGSRKFVDQVLSRLTDLLENENDSTRLQVVYKQTVDRDTGRPIDSWNCYIQVHERGPEAQMVNRLMAATVARDRITRVTG